jgi:uncharacterized phiE125 gp8 family phage protein
MRKKLITAATFKPLTLDEVKSFALRQTSEEDEAYIYRLIDAATDAYENFTERILCLSTWDLYLDAFPSEIELPGPLSSVTSVGYQDTNDAAQTMTASYYVVDTVSEPARICLAYEQSWPETYAEINVVTVRFIAGYANAAAIPATIKDGLYLYIQEQYDGIDRQRAYEALWMPLRIMHP